MSRFAFDHVYCLCDYGAKGGPDLKVPPPTPSHLGASLQMEVIDLLVFDSLIMAKKSFASLHHIRLICLMMKLKMAGTGRRLLHPFHLALVALKSKNCRRHVSIPTKTKFYDSSQCFDIK